MISIFMRSNNILFYYYLNYLLNILINNKWINNKLQKYILLYINIQEKYWRGILEENILVFGKPCTVLWYRIQLVIYDTL